MRIVALIAAGLCAATPARAGDWTFHGFDPPATYTGEVGLRFGLGSATTGKNLYDSSGSLLVSRLTYGNMQSYSAEAYGRFDLNTGWFLKGLIGGGGFRGGNLKDEDFPPGITPYSATLSVINNSFPAYATLDIGYNLVRGGDFRVGAFVGYNYMRQVVGALGCGQVGYNPFICGFVPVPATIKVITQDNSWNSMRLGLDGTFDITKRLRFGVDAAWLPLVALGGTDFHWLRIDQLPGDFNGGIPEDGNGWGYQLEGLLSYQLTDSISVGIGGRYWHAQTQGLTHFEGHVHDVPAVAQPVDWKTDNIGAFVQTGLRFGPNPIISSN